MKYTINYEDKMIEIEADRFFFQENYAVFNNDKGGNVAVFSAPESVISGEVTIKITAVAGLTSGGIKVFKDAPDE